MSAIESAPKLTRLAAIAARIGVGIASKRRTALEGTLGLRRMPAGELGRIATAATVPSCGPFPIAAGARRSALSMHCAPVAAALALRNAAVGVAIGRYKTRGGVLKAGGVLGATLGDACCWRRGEVGR